MALVNMEKVDKGKVKEMVKALNPHLDEHQMEKIRVVGITPQAMADGFTIQVEALADSGKLDAIKAKSPEIIEFYNGLEFFEGGASEWLQKGAAAPAPAPPPPPPAAAATAEAPAAGAEAAVPEQKKTRGRKAAPAAPADPNAPPKKRGNPPKSGLMSRPTSWEDLQKRLAAPPTPTAYMDHLTLAGGDPAKLVEAFQEWRKTNAPDYAAHFRNVSGLKAHIEYRKTKGWIYEEKENFVKLVGYKA